MPTITTIGPYRFFFYASDKNEPSHVHVQRDRSTAKFWLTPVRLQRSRRFGDRELRKLQHIVIENVEQFQEEWDEYFNP